MNTKRAFDIVAASGGMIVAAPIMLVTAFTMAAANRSLSPLYKQERVGLNGKPFKIYKIKSMKDLVDENGRALPDEMRTSKLGIMLKKSRLDELPQLFNVISGDMSMVGPRPVPPYESLSHDQKRHTILPGLTGLAQIAGKNGLSDDKVLKLDHEYVDRNNIYQDLKIILATPLSLFKNRHTSHFNPDGQALHAHDL